MASDFRAPTSPDAPNGVFSPSVLTNGARIHVQYGDMSPNDFVVVRWGAGYTANPQPSSSGAAVEVLIPANEVLKTAGQTLLVSYRVIYPGGPGVSNAATFTVPMNLTQIAITDVRDSNDKPIPSGGITSSTRVTLYGTAS